jgi:hypothetical protein
MRLAAHQSSTRAEARRRMRGRAGAFRVPAPHRAVRANEHVCHPFLGSPCFPKISKAPQCGHRVDRFDWWLVLAIGYPSSGAGRVDGFGAPRDRQGLAPPDTQSENMSGRRLGSWRAIVARGRGRRCLNPLRKSPFHPPSSSTPPPGAAVHRMRNSWIWRSARRRRRGGARRGRREPDRRASPWPNGRRKGR